MYYYSTSSQEKLATCDQRLQKIFSIVIQLMDCTIICGERGKGEQDRAFSIGKSQLEYPNSKHNSHPSMAVDAAPYPVDWDAIVDFYRMAGIAQGVAKCLGVDITWGGEFKTLKDYCHFEIAD